MVKNYLQEIDKIVWFGFRVRLLHELVSGTIAAFFDRHFGFRKNAKSEKIWKYKRFFVKFRKDEFVNRKNMYFFQIFHTPIWNLE